VPVPSADPADRALGEREHSLESRLAALGGEAKASETERNKVREFELGDDAL
jgi:hypothetical protein